MSAFLSFNANNTNNFNFDANNFDANNFNINDPNNNSFQIKIPKNNNENYNIKHLGITYSGNKYCAIPNESQNQEDITKYSPLFSIILNNNENKIILNSSGILDIQNISDLQSIQIIPESEYFEPDKLNIEIEWGE